MPDSTPQLPTKEELEQLYQDRGKDALVWYAWRGVIRVFPRIGGVEWHEFWDVEDIFDGIFNLCKVPLIVSQWGQDDFSINAIWRELYSRSFTMKGIVHPVEALSLKMAGIVNKSIDLHAAKGVVDCIDDRRFLAEVYDLTVSIVEFDSFLVVDFRTDVDFLVQRPCFDYFTDSFCLPLWSLGEPTWLRRELAKLQEKLVEIDLDFLANDLDLLLKQSQTKGWWVNYMKPLSKVVEADPALLERAILYGEIDYVHSVRVILLGSGGAGKSSLADLLLGRKVKVYKRPTIGVDYQKHVPVNLQALFDRDGWGNLDFQWEDSSSPELGVNTKLDAYIWDFGGQTIFHGLHSAFLHENCVYVLVVDSRHEQAPDEWLHQIRHLAGSQAKVLLVTNEYEECKTKQNETRLLREFGDLLSPDSFFYFSCLDKDAPEFRKFVEALVQASLDSQKMVLKETLDVQEALQSQYEDDVFLDEDTLQSVIEQTTGNTDNAPAMADKLQQLGFLVKVDGDGEHFCLKPAWAVDHAYQLLYSPQLRDGQGVQSLQNLKQGFGEKLEKSRYVKRLVTFLQERSLCQKLGDGNYFFPDAAPANEPQAATMILTADNPLVIRFDLPYLPLGFHTRLVNSLFVSGSDVRIESPNDIWRQGFVLRKGTSQAVVHYLLRKNVIEMVFAGELQDFAGLLSALYVNMKQVVTAKDGLRVEQIHPSVNMNDQLFSVHSAESLVQVLSQISDYGQLFEKVRAMTGKTVIQHSTITDSQIGDHNKQHSDNVSITVTADQCQQIASVLAAMQNIDAQSSLGKAVQQVETALQQPEQPESQSLLGRAWKGLNDIAGFANNSLQIGQTIDQWVVNKQAEIAAAIAVATSVTG